MSKRYWASAIAAVAALSTTAPASACRSGGTQHLFESPPAVDRADSEVLHVQFSNQNEASRMWRERQPSRDIYSLIGVARIQGSRTTREGGWFPVYALVTSCSAFWGSPPVVEMNAYLVGSFERTTGHGRAFIADAKRWGADEDTRLTS